MKQVEEVKVVVFDLNGTFYNKSSKTEFFKFISLKDLSRLRYIFEMGYFHVLQKLNLIGQTKFKENYFNYLNNLPPEEVEQLGREFWKKEYPANFNSELIQKFDQYKKDKVLLFCATGTLELYVKPLFDFYQIDGFSGTRVKYNGHSYLSEGPACKGEEKLKRLEEFLNGRPYRLIEAYSDKEEPILDKAEKAFLVNDGKIVPYKSGKNN